MAKRPLKFIDNLRLSGHEGLWQLAIEQGRIAHLVPQPEGQEWRGDVLDAQGGLALPAFVEPHIHLDTTQTAGQPAWNQSGTLFEGIERWAERKALLTHEDVKQRAWQTLKWQIANGVQYVRTHVDVSDPTLTALRAILEVKQEVAPWVTLQIVAFPQEGILSYPNGEALLEEALRLGADVVGAIPHFEFTREYGVESLHKAFALAQKYDRLVDVHCDEIDDEQSRFVEIEIFGVFCGLSCTTSNFYLLLKFIKVFGKKTKGQDRTLFYLFNNNSNLSHFFESTSDSLIPYICS